MHYGDFDEKKNRYKVKEWFPLKNGHLIVKLEDDKGVNDYDTAKLVPSHHHHRNWCTTRPSHFGSFILSHSKRLMKDVIRQIGGFYNNSIYYTDTDSLYIHKQYGSELVANGFHVKTLGIGGKDYGNSGIFYAWLLAPKKKCCLVIDDFGVNLAKRTSKGYCGEHRMIELNEYISVSEGKVIFGRFSIDWTKTFEGMKIPHEKQDCLDSDFGKICSDCDIKAKTNCYNCEMSRKSKMC